MHYHPMSITASMSEMLAVFEEICKERETLRQLSAMVSDRGRWQNAKVLFEQIRNKTLKAEKRKDDLALAQYSFEEICAKTIFNLTYPDAPFDSDSAFWVIPRAIALGRKLGFTDPSEITSLLKMKSASQEMPQADSSR
jgi:hypothetical protein